MSGSFECFHDPDVLQQYLRRDPYLYLYCLGDLEEFYWKHTVWYGMRDCSGELAALVMGYFSSHPVFLAYAVPGSEECLRTLISHLRPFLPRHFHLHVSSGLADALAPDYVVESSQHLSRMALRQANKIYQVEAEGVLLGPQDLGEVEEFYRVAYPGNWFEARMLDSGQYFGIRRAGHLVAVAGVHVYSPAQKVAALGNIATLPDWRGRGLSAAVTATLCRSLLETVETVGLNVLTHNTGAVRVYEKLGFEPHTAYQELVVVAGQGSA